MTFTIAEDILTLLTAHLTIDRNVGDAYALNPGFELDKLYYWDFGFSIDETVPRTGLKCAKMDNTSEQWGVVGLSVPVSLVTEFSWYMRFAAGSTSATVTLKVVYHDGTEYTDNISFNNGDTWIKYDYTANLTANKLIAGFFWDLDDANEVVFFDDNVLDYDTDIAFNLFSASDYDTQYIRLLEDYEPSNNPVNGEIIIGRERLLRIDSFNGSRSETFLVDIELSFEDNTATAPTILKKKLAEIDKIFDGESMAHTSYFYKSRYDWNGSYREGVVQFQVEVLNALVTRPGLL